MSEERVLPSTKANHADRHLVATCTNVKSVVETTPQTNVQSQTGTSETHRLPPLALPNKIATPIAVTALVPLLAGYDNQLKNYVVNGLTNGFSIGCVGSRSTLDLSMRNLRSAY